MFFNLKGYFVTVKFKHLVHVTLFTAVFLNSSSLFNMNLPNTIVTRTLWASGRFHSHPTPPPPNRDKKKKANMKPKKKKKIFKEND